MSEQLVYTIVAMLLAASGMAMTYRIGHFRGFEAGLDVRITTEVVSKLEGLEEWLDNIEKKEEQP